MATGRSAIELLRYYNQALVFSLPMNNAEFLDELYKQGAIFKDFKHHLESMTTCSKRASCFLEHVIKPSLTLGDNTYFVEMLTVMKNCNFDNVKDLAEQIETECK